MNLKHGYIEAGPSVWSVAVLGRPHKVLAYLEPAYLPARVWQPGLRVLVPFGRADALRVAVLMRTNHVRYRAEKLKQILWPLEKEPVINPDYLEMLENLASRQLITPGKVLSYVLPKALRKIPHGWVDLNRKKKIPFVFFENDPKIISEVSELWMTDRLHLDFGTARIDPCYKVCKGPPWSIRPGASLQWAVMDLLWEQRAMLRSKITSALGQGANKSLKSLLDKKLIEQVQDEKQNLNCSLDVPGKEYELTQDQKDVLSGLIPRLEQKKPAAIMLHGITGSGKSVVYLNLVKNCLRQGRSAIILAPEIAIARQLYHQTVQFLPGVPVFLQHGNKSDKNKEKNFLEISRSRSPLVMVGTRSALFMPVKNIGLIVLDEEHDESFKQDQQLIYQAKEISYYLSGRDNGLLVLGSATPDIKTYHAALQGRIQMAHMSRRIGSSTLPEVTFVDLKKEPPAFGPLSAGCYRALEETLDRGEQAIIMHNRRGYTPILMCVECSETARCAGCKVSLTYHKKRNRLVCHYCGISVSYPPICEQCRSSEFIPLGQGTEKVEEYLSRHLPRIEVLRLDSDTSRQSGHSEEILEKFASGRAQVLVGTQMLSKGHSFPDVTLAIVPDADLGLGLPDYRSTERIFQLLVQLSGRAGRGSKPGRVFIQTRNPDHFCWQYIMNNDYQGFFNQELKRRKTYSYPPFIKLGLIRFSFPSSWSHKDKLMSALRQKKPELVRNNGLTLLGPAPALLSRLKNRERHHLLIKSTDWNSIRRAYTELQPIFEKHRELRVSLDLDPVNML